MFSFLFANHDENCVELFRVVYFCALRRKSRKIFLMKDDTGQREKVCYTKKKTDFYKLLHIRDCGVKKIVLLNVLRYQLQSLQIQQHLRCHSILCLLAILKILTNDYFWFLNSTMMKKIIKSIKYEIKFLPSNDIARFHF